MLENPIFIQNKENDYIVNLNNVTNVFVTNCNDGVHEKRLVFNMNYMVKLNRGFQSDFVYWDFKNGEDADLAINEIFYKVSTLNWVSHKNSIINLNEVSSIKLKHNCIILNFKSGKLIQGGQKVTSDYMYLNFSSDFERDSFYNFFLSKFVEEI